MIPQWNASALCAALAAMEHRALRKPMDGLGRICGLLASWERPKAHFLGDAKLELGKQRGTVRRMGMFEMEVCCVAALRILHSDVMAQWPWPDMLNNLGRKVEDTLASGQAVLFE